MGRWCNVASVPWWTLPATCIATLVAVVALLAWADVAWRRSEARRSVAAEDETPGRGTRDTDETLTATERDALRDAFDRVIRDGYYD